MLRKVAKKGIKIGSTGNKGCGGDGFSLISYDIIIVNIIIVGIVLFLLCVFLKLWGLV